MPSPDNSLNISTDDPDDYMYVSKKNWARKKQLQDGNGDQLTKLVGRPGPLTGIVLSVFDMISTFFIRITVILLQITSISFDWMNNLIFSNLKGLIPNEVTKGAVISLKWFRYALTIMMPPMGVFLSKGIYGWFNIIVCTILTYINFLVGMIYAFVITMRNRYADQFEEHSYARAIINNPIEDSTADINLFIYTICFILLIAFVIFLMLYYF